MDMVEPTYAVVSYLPGELREFVDGLRRRFDPALAAWQAHVTILPPRAIEDAMHRPLDTLRNYCAQVQPFELTLRGVATFLPVNGVVYLAIGAGTERLVELHDGLNCDGLRSQEPYPYVPHVTIAQELDQETTENVRAEIQREWSRCPSGGLFRIESLVLVKKTQENHWENLATIALGDHR